MNEQEQFLSDIGSDQNHGIDVMNQPFDQQPVKEVEPKVEAPAGDEDDKEGVKPKNRREKRLMQKLQEERESSMFLAGKLEAREEAKSLFNEEADYLKSVEGIYGTDTPEAILATNLLKKAIVGARDDAKQAAIAEMKAERQQEIDSNKKLAKELESFIDDIEDTYGMEFTQAQEKSFLQLLTKMSSKDKDGKVISYADHHTVYEVFQDRLKSQGTDNRAKDLSARSMTASGASKETTLPDDSAVQFLTQNGII